MGPLGADGMGSDINAAYRQVESVNLAPSGGCKA